MLKLVAFIIFVSLSQAAFRVPYLTQTILQRLLYRCPVKEHSDPSIPLFTRGVPSDQVVLILQVRYFQVVCP